MEKVITGVTFLYLLSSAGYLSYLFLQKNALQQISGYILMTAFLCHTATLGYNFFLSGLIPVRDLHEALSMAAWTLSGVYILSLYRFNLKILGAFAVR
jgi:hypothetical protein